MRCRCLVILLEGHSPAGVGLPDGVEARIVPVHSVEPYISPINPLWREGHVGLARVPGLTSLTSVLIFRSPAKQQLQDAAAVNTT